MAAPDLRTAVRTGAAHLDVMAGELAELERDHRVTEPRYAELQHRFEVLGGYTLDQRVDATLSGLGFTRDEWTKPPGALSGGEQTRAALARLVIADPDLLLLDEPTNHLDLDALEWLEEHLRRRSGSLIVATHDRAFLDATVTRIWELRDRRLTVFRGDYSAYHRQRERARRPAREGRRDPGRGDRSRAGARPALPEPPQVREDARARGPPRAAPRRAGRGAEGRPTAQARPTTALAGGRSGPLRRDRRPGRGPRRRLPAPVPARGRTAGSTRIRSMRPTTSRATTAGVGPVARRPLRPVRRAARRRPHPVPRRPARRADRDRRPERRRQDDAPADDRRRPAAARRRPHHRQRRLDRLPRPAARRRRSPARPSSTRCSRRSR